MVGLANSFACKFIQSCLLRSPCSGTRPHSTICPVQVLFSRYVGQIRQGRWADPQKVDWPSQSPAMKALLLNASRSFPDFKAAAMEEFKRADIAARLE